MINKFDFDEKTVHHYMKRELKVFEQNSEAFRYIADKLPQNTELDLYKAKWISGKNYDWCTISVDNVTLIIRQYGAKFVVYTKVVNRMHFKDDMFYFTTIYGGLKFETKFENDSDEEFDADGYYVDLNNALPQLVEIIKKEQLHTIWNTLSFTRPERVDVKTVFHGETIYSVDDLIFMLDEISQKYLELFSENDMLKRIIEFKEGEKFGDGNIINSVLSTDEITEDEYYHKYGINYNDKNGNNEWNDIYCLTRYHFQEMFPNHVPVQNDLIPIVKKINE